MTRAHDDNLIWIDLEMTGLDTDNDSILEIATIVTDKDLNVLAEGPVFAISHADARLQQMDAWNRNQHGRSGLWQRVVESDDSVELAEQSTIDFLAHWVHPGKSPMCGNSICQDRRFLHREMPKLERFFHYRNLDVSTLKELSRRWSPDIARGFSKDSAHTALSDIRDSIDELRYYRRFMGPMAGTIPG
ncbi:oligoribonuclease [Bacillus sp. NP157]|nr:oligoribonuclease [Bacillus sp. NP157]